MIFQCLCVLGVDFCPRVDIIHKWVRGGGGGVPYNGTAQYYVHIPRPPPSLIFVNPCGTAAWDYYSLQWPNFSKNKRWLLTSTMQD